MKTAMLLLTLFQSADLFPVTAKPEPPKQTRREWYLVSEPWCVYCPAAKKRFLSLGWPEANVLTLDECEKKFGFRPSKVPFEFGDPNWKTESTSVTRTPAKSDGQIFGRTGTSHESRETLIKHLLSDGIHAGKHTSAELSAMTDEQLDSLHNREHNQSAGTPASTTWTIRTQQPRVQTRRRGFLFWRR